MQLTTMSIWLFIGLAAAMAGVLAVLQCLRIRPRQVRVITTLFWQQAADQARARTLLERFRHPRTYLLLLAVSLLLLLALGRPIFNTAPQPHRVILLEAGMAMTAATRGAADDRFDNALALVRAEAASLSEDRVAVITADPHPRLLKHFNESRVTLEDRLAKVRAASTPINRDEILRAATSMIAGRDGGEVVLVAAQPVTTDDEQVRVLAAGEVFSNAFVLSATFVPEQADRTRGTFHCRVGFTSKQEGQVTVKVDRADKTMLEQSVKFKPAEVKEFFVPGIAADGSLLSVSLTGSDAVLSDSLLDFRLPNRRRILVVPASASQLPPALKSVLDSLPEVTTEADEGSDLPVVRVGQGDNDAQILIQPDDAGGEWMTVRSSGHPLVEGLVFEDALCRAPATPLDIASGGLPLLRAGGSPVATLSADASQLTVSETILSEDASLVRRTGYVVFWSNMLQHLAGWRHEPLALSPRQASRSTNAASTSLTLKADLSNFDLAADAEAAKPAEIAGVELPVWQLLLAAALMLMTIEAALNIRGRIS